MSQQAFVSMIANALQAYKNCMVSHNTNWEKIWRSRLENEVNDNLPNGSGFDSGSTFDVDASNPNRLIFHTSFHHMNNDGYYDGWTDHDIIVTPDFVHGFNLRITGCNKNDIKDYLHECFQEALSKMNIEWEAPNL